MNLFKYSCISCWCIIFRNKFHFCWNLFTICVHPFNKLMTCLSNCCRTNWSWCYRFTNTFISSRYRTHWRIIYCIVDNFTCFYKTCFKFDITTWSFKRITTSISSSVILPSNKDISFFFRNLCCNSHLFNCLYSCCFRNCIFFCTFSNIRYINSFCCSICLNYIMICCLTTKWNT